MNSIEQAVEGRLTHLDGSGQAHMVGISHKAPTYRQATASAQVIMSPQTLAAIMSATSAKGDVLSVARIAGITAVKRTSDLIPLAHPLAIEACSVEFDTAGPTCLIVKATVAVTGKTGVEMEVLAAVSIAALTVYDMCKSADVGMKITEIQLDEKSGGKSGHYRRPGA